MENLCRELLDAKAAEEFAKNRRISIENKIAALFDPFKLEGTETKKTGKYKISVTSKLTRKLDYEKYQALQLPENLGFVDFKPEINLKNLRMMERIDPAIVTQCVTVMPAKKSVKVEEVAE